jgi:hypothetical protein
MTEKRTSWVLDVLPDPTDPEGCMLEFPPDLLETAGWKEGDVLVWTDLGNGSWSMTKKE